MNLIACVKDCIHQKDGYCNLNSQAHLGQKIDGCCYYQPISAPSHSNQLPEEEKMSNSPVQE